MTAAGEEGQFLCDAVAAAVVPGANGFLPVLQRVGPNRVVMEHGCVQAAAKRIAMAHGFCFGEEADVRNIVLF